MGRHAGKCATGLFRRRKVDPYHDRYRGRSLLTARQCSKTFLAPYDKPLDGMCLLMEQAEMILKMLVDGMSVSAIERMTGVHHGKSLRLLVLAGERCEKIMGRYARNVRARNIEMNEIWSFIGKTEKGVRPEADQNLGDAYTFIAIERNTKLVLNITMGKRDQQTIDIFVEGVRDALAPGCQVQITTDGFAPYRRAVPNASAPASSNAAI
jgi:transposase-like protein/IS1 family transposase